MSWLTVSRPQDIGFARHYSFSGTEVGGVLRLSLWRDWPVCGSTGGVYKYFVQKLSCFLVLHHYLPEPRIPAKRVTLPQTTFIDVYFVILLLQQQYTKPIN